MFSTLAANAFNENMDRNVYHLVHLISTLKLKHHWMFDANDRHLNFNIMAF